MTTLKVGDRVRVYNGNQVGCGEVIPLPEKSYPGAVNVLFNDGQQYWKCMVHEKQCRRIVKREKKKPREFELHVVGGERNVLAYGVGDKPVKLKQNEVIRVREVIEG
jgi:hypothetical protein